ncbi:spectrin-like nuclear envelope protein [Schistosoma mansoni]|uniref:spectrin-like nuclear envelope protein n=1 Tax=Schistosoma mansoni TaxID=6183 RepID=UPI00022DC9FF|nr:spectrin-like nuclear envelope protein [Schistosoma mansoni]|eukprot:XP_018655682.1 spectrin-like nuclear envelope protein [Schistosoma mansoni]
MLEDDTTQINKKKRSNEYSSSSNQHDHLCHDDQHCTKHLNYTEWDSLKSIELNENVKPVSNLLVLDQLSTISNNNDHDHKSPRTDDTTTIESWTPSIDQSFIRQELLLNRMKSWKLYRNTSPLNYFSNMNNNTSNMDNLPEKYSVKCRFRTFEDVPKDQIDDNLATVHIFNQYLMNNEYEHGDQLQILTNAHSSPDISENLTEQFITPSVSDGVTLDADNQELDHNTRLNARHRIYDEYLKSLEKRYNIKMNQSNEEMNRTKNLMDYDLIPHSLYITTSVDGLHSMLTTVQMDSLKSEQERVQKKTFTNWLNTYLSNANPPFKVQDLFEDIKNGILLIRILEVLSGEKLVKLVNVNPTDIADGKPAIVLGLIWVIILYFQVKELLLKILDLPPGSLKTRGSAKRALQAWVQEIFAGKYDVQIRDFGPSWRDGIAFNAMVHNIDSSLVEMDKVKTRTPKENLEHAFTQAEKHLGIPRLLDPEDVDVDRPDEKSIVTYVAQFFKAYPDAGRRRSDSPTKTNVKVKLDNLMKFIRESESKMKTVRFGHTNLNEQYQVYEELIARKEMEEENYESLKDQWYSGLISHTDSLINPSEVEILEESWNHFTDIMNEWLWEIDEKIPGEFGRIAKWLSQAEKWFKQVGLKWYQKPSGTQAMGFCVTVNQSWRPSSAEPPNSPPSNELIDKLQNERLEIFGTNNQKLNSIRDDLSRIIDNEKKINLPNTLIDRLSTRLSKVIGYEPGHSAVLCAAKSRRTFLDILYNVNRTETNTGVRIRSRRRESATGFEYRFCNWLDLVDGNIHTETKEIVNGILNDYQLCLKTEHIPEKLDQCERIKQRLTIWDKLDHCNKNIENLLSQFEDSTFSENDWLSRRDEIFLLLEEANEAAHYLGESADHHRLEMFRKRIEKVESDVKKLEAKRMADKLKFENEMNNHLNKIEYWIDKVKNLIENKTNSKLKNLQIRCTSNEFSMIIEQLQELLNQQPQNAEKVIKRKLINKQSIDETFTTLKQQMDEIQIALKDLKYATSSSGGIRKEDLLNLLENLKKIYNIAEGQLRKLNSFSSQIGSSRKWLQKCCNEHTDKLNDLIKSDLDHTDSLDQLEAKHKCLTEFASILNKEGEAHLIKCQEEIQHILDSDECYDTTVIIMLTRRELSNFQSELNIISRENDKELKEIEAKIARQSKFISHIEAEEKWLNDLENKMNQDHSHLNNSQSTAELLQNIQTETDRYNQLLSNINTHDQQIDEQLYPEAQSLKDSSSLQRIDNLKGQIKTLKQNLEKMVTNLNVQTKSIHAFQQAVEKFKLNLKNFESQRSSILEAQTVSYVNMESDSQLLEEFYMNMKKQIEVNLLINETLTDTLKLNELLIELEGFKHDVLDPYEVLYNKTDLKLPKDYVTNFKKRYDTCLTIVKDKTEEIQNHIMKLRKLKEKVEEFNKSFEGAHIKYKMLFNQFKIEFDEQYTHCKLSEICQLIMKMMQQIISHLKEYDLNFIEKLQTTLKDISSQALECELKLAFENSLLFDRLNSLKSEITDYTHGLDELYNQLKSHTTDIINYEQWFENIDKQYQQTKTNYTIGNLVFNKSSLYQSITECSIHELENESNNNSASLGQLNSHYQKSLQTLLELRKLVLEYNPSINILTEKLLTLIRQIINIHKSFSKINIDLQSNRQIINNPMIYGIDIIEQNCINMKSIYQNLMNHINQDINNIQIKSTYLIQLIQSNKDLDIWIKDCISK